MTDIDVAEILAAHDVSTDSRWEGVLWCEACWLAGCPDAYHECEPYLLAKEIMRLRHNYRSLLAIHAAVKMDTPEDQELHDRAVATFTTALEG
jgi:hypothetical protein